MGRTPLLSEYSLKLDDYLIDAIGVLRGCAVASKRRYTLTSSCKLINQRIEGLFWTQPHRIFLLTISTITLHIEAYLLDRSLRYSHSLVDSTYIRLQ